MNFGNISTEHGVYPQILLEQQEKNQDVKLTLMCVVTSLTAMAVIFSNLSLCLLPVA